MNSTINMSQAVKSHSQKNASNKNTVWYSVHIFYLKMIQLVDSPTVILSFCILTNEPMHSYTEM